MSSPRWITRKLAFLTVAFAMTGFISQASAQIVINELVKEVRTAGSSAVSAETREFLELYNSGTTAVDLSGWSMVTTVSSTGNIINDVLPAGATIAPGGYYVIAAAGRAITNANHYISIGASDELFPDILNGVIEIRNSSSALVDAVAYDTFRAPQLTTLTPEQTAQVGNGYWGQLISLNASSPNIPTSLARYQNGKDTNNNGFDFGHLPITPGASNNSGSIGQYLPPDVDAVAVGSELSAGVNASFVLPRVINPTVADGVNPKAIPVSPQGGRAIMAWDETGGGNAVYTNKLANSFRLSAYIESSPIGLAATTAVSEWEQSIYGLGSTDAFFTVFDPTSVLGLTSGIASNGSTGIGWAIQRVERYDAGVVTVHNLLQLIDFKGGGNSLAGAWEVLEEIDLVAESVASGWYDLGIDYDPATGAVEAVFNGTTYNKTVSANRDGTFYIGYREAMSNLPGSAIGLSRPPTFDLMVATPAEDADFNNDGIVDGKDFLAWQRGFGGPGGLPQGDADGNGQVNAADLTIWKVQFGTSPATAAAAAIPEPASAIMLAVAAFGIPLLRRNPSANAL
jgi:hypothetical protein